MSFRLARFSSSSNGETIKSAGASSSTLVTTPLIVQGHIQVKLPKASAQSTASVQPLIITLTAEGRIFKGDQETSLQDLLSLLREELKTRVEKQVIINADRSVMHGRVVAVMDIAKQAGAEKLAIATESGSEK